MTRYNINAGKNNFIVPDTYTKYSQVVSATTHLKLTINH